jgi:hypothetical protein
MMKQVFFTFILTLLFCLSSFGQTQNQLCAKTEDTGGVVEAGTPMKFVAAVSGKTDGLILEYEWKVSAGTIMSGQGTCAITVDTTGLANGTNITAEVTVKGFPENCSNTASETGSVIVSTINGGPIDEFGKIPNDEVRARLDALFAGLGIEPNAQGYIINYGTDAEITARERLIRNHAAMRKFDVNRITFIKGGANPRGESGARSRVYSLFRLLIRSYSPTRCGLFPMAKTLMSARPARKPPMCAA